MISGHCECGRVAYEAEGPIEDFSHCHCSQCRRLHGAAFATFAGVAGNGFRFVEGESDVRSYASSPALERVFCSVCGSNILVRMAQEPEALYLCMGTVDGDPPRPRGYHIFVGSKAPWHEITDGLPQHEAEPAIWP